MKHTSVVLTGLLLVLGGTPSAFAATVTFQSRVNLGSAINIDDFDDRNPTLTADGLILIFNSNRPGGEGQDDLWQATRASVSDPFGTPSNLTINSNLTEVAPSISPDGLNLYFASGGGEGSFDIYVATRASLEDPFGARVNLGTGVNTSASENNPAISGDGLSLYFHSNRAGGFGDRDIWVSTRASTADLFGTPVDLGVGINTSSGEFAPHITGDGLTLYFSSGRTGGEGDNDIYSATRASTGDAFAMPTNLGPAINSSGPDSGSHLGPDGLYFHSLEADGEDFDIYFAAPVPEPSRTLLSLLALGAVCLRRRRSLS